MGRRAVVTLVEPCPAAEEAASAVSLSRSFSRQTVLRPAGSSIKAPWPDPTTGEPFEGLGRATSLKIEVTFDKSEPRTYEIEPERVLSWVDDFMMCCDIGLNVGMLECWLGIAQEGHMGKIVLASGEAFEVPECDLKRVIEDRENKSRRIKGYTI